MGEWCCPLRFALRYGTYRPNRGVFPAFLPNVLPCKFMLLTPWRGRGGSRGHLFDIGPKEGVNVIRPGARKTPASKPEGAVGDKFSALPPPSGGGVACPVLFLHYFLYRNQVKSYKK